MSKKQYRSAVTGKTVTKEYADANPATTYSTSIQEKDMPRRKAANTPAEETTNETTAVDAVETAATEPSAVPAEDPAVDAPDGLGVEEATEPIAATETAPDTDSVADENEVEKPSPSIDDLTSEQLEDIRKNAPATKDEALADIENLPESDRQLAKDLIDRLYESDEPVVKSGGRKVSVRGFFGSFKNSNFVEDSDFVWGTAENVDDETYNALITEFPNAEIKVS